MMRLGLAGECQALFRRQCCEARRTAPEVDEACNAGLGIAHRNRLAQAHFDLGDIGIHLPLERAAVAQQMEQRRLDQRQARNAFGPRHGKLERHRAAIGMADQMHPLRRRGPTGARSHKPRPRASRRSPWRRQRHSRAGSAVRRSWPRGNCAARPVHCAGLAGAAMQQHHRQSCGEGAHLSPSRGRMMDGGEDHAALDADILEQVIGQVGQAAARGMPPPLGRGRAVRRAWKKPSTRHFCRARRSHLVKSRSVTF